MTKQQTRKYEMLEFCGAVVDRGSTSNHMGEYRLGIEQASGWLSSQSVALAVFEAVVG